MTQVFDQEGRAIPVTVVSAPPCTIVQKKTVERDGYVAVQIGCEDVKARHLSRPQLGHFKAAGLSPRRVVEEVRVDGSEELEVGQEVTVEAFAAGDLVKVTGRTKGRGFQGVIRRHGFRGGRKTHGSHFHRSGGSIGASAWPARVMKGRGMPGHMGNARVSVKNLEVVEVIAEDHLLLIKGSVPGSKNGLLRITKR
jgi:large subunit ribosomal protein L3